MPRAKRKTESETQSRSRIENSRVEAKCRNLFDRLMRKKDAKETKDRKESTRGEVKTKVQMEDAIMSNVKAGPSDQSMVGSRVGKKLARENVYSYEEVFDAQLEAAEKGKIASKLTTFFGRMTKFKSYFHLTQFCAEVGAALAGCDSVVSFALCKNAKATARANRVRKARHEKMDQHRKLVAKETAASVGNDGASEEDYYAEMVAGRRRGE